MVGSKRSSPALPFKSGSGSKSSFVVQSLDHITRGQGQIRVTTCTITLSPKDRSGAWATRVRHVGETRPTRRLFGGSGGEEICALVWCKEDGRS
nr:hypothetical protein Iba_chr14dCG1090 [Ipomoea batatas]